MRRRDGRHRGTTSGHDPDESVRDSARVAGAEWGRLSMKTRVFVTLKPSVFDPQGRTIVEALGSMGYASVHDVRQGKYFELEVAAATVDEARATASDVADKLLANPVIESYRVEVDGDDGP